MYMYHIVFALSLVSPSIAFIDDSLSESVTPFVKIQDLPQESDYKRQIDISQNEYVLSAKYRLGCPDDTTITFYNANTDDALTGTKQSDYYVICSGSSQEPICIASKDGQVVSVPDITTIKSISTFDELINAGYNIIFEGELTESDMDMVNPDIPDIQTVYNALKKSVLTFIISSAKLASGGDYGNDECIDRFHVWSMYLSKAFTYYIDQDNTDNRWDTIIDDASCITEAIEADVNGERPKDLETARTECPNTIQRATERAMKEPANQRRLVNTYTKSEIREYIEDEGHCPDGGDVVNACSNDKFGMCGYQSMCWEWICPSNSYNGDSCGCNNGCFEHDYSCWCDSEFSLECWIPFNALFADKTCHAGSTCIDIDKMQNIRKINRNMDPWWGWGEPYVQIEPKTPHGSSRWTDYAGIDYSSNSYTFDSDDNKRMCWSMRFTDFHIRIMDSDYDFDDVEWSDVVTTNEATTSVGSGSGNTPKITFNIDKRGW